MKKPVPFLICDDTHGHHVWDAEFTDGDTCACGRFYLDLHAAHGFAAELQETPEPETTGAARRLKEPA
jgi:hypothetical protein